MTTLTTEPSSSIQLLDNHLQNLSLSLIHLSSETVTPGQSNPAMTTAYPREDRHSVHPSNTVSRIPSPDCNPGPQPYSKPPPGSCHSRKGKNRGKHASPSSVPPPDVSALQDHLFNLEETNHSIMDALSTLTDLMSNQRTAPPPTSHPLDIEEIAIQEFSPPPTPGG